MSPSAPFSVQLLTPKTRALWIMVFAVTVMSEVCPVPLMSPARFYCYYLFRSACFFAVGFLAPLAFYSFSALNLGVVLAAAAATLIESLQGLVGWGHSFHWHELAGKLLLILFGFALALNARYDLKIVIGPIRVKIIAEHMVP
jgi:hypothetical protein